MSHKIRRSLPNTCGQYDKKSGIVYTADGWCNPGGLCDRLYGIVSLYKISKDQQVPFYIDFAVPFSISDYLLPNIVDWRIVREKGTLVDKHKTILYVFCSSKEYDYPLCKESEIQRKFLINNMANKAVLYQVYTNAHLVENPIEFSKLYNELFVPSRPLLDAVNINTRNINATYVAIVLRFQNLLGDFVEGKTAPLEEAKQRDLINKLQRKIGEIHFQNPRRKVLVTSDSRKFLDSLGFLDYVYTIPGNVVHMSFTNDKSFETHLKSFVDLYMVSNADKIFLISTGNMYHSGFAKLASMIHNKPYYEIFF